MKTLVFSDVHLQVVESGDLRKQAFTRFLRSIDPARVDRLICLGDLFDFWFEYRQVIFSAYFDVLRAFAELHDAGVSLYLVCGNHDFWAGRFLEESLGFRVYQTPVYLPFGDKRTLLAHGDGLNPHDRGYLLYKRIARSPLIVSLFRLIHPDWAMGIARMVSHGSRQLNGERDPSKGAEARALRDFAQKALSGERVVAAPSADVNATTPSNRIDAVLCGHSHHPVIEQFETGVYINSGDWIQHQSYVEWDEKEGFRLCEFEG